MSPEPTLETLAAVAPPSAADRERWAAADRAARPARLARLRQRLAEAQVDAYFGVRSENSRYLTGFALGDGEDRVAGNSGQFLVRPDEVALLADSRYTEQAGEEAPDARIVPAYHDLAERWPHLVQGCRRVAVEGAYVSRLTWDRLAEAAPDVELVPMEGWVEAQRATKEPSEIERIAAACAVADAALARLLPSLRPGYDRGPGRPRPRMGDADQRGRRSGVRCRRPRWPPGGPAPRLAGGPQDPGRPGPAIRLRGAGGRLPQRHDPDPLRRAAHRR